MKTNEKGQALVIVLFFSAIALLIIGAVLLMVLRGQAMSGIGKQYQSSLDAGYAGVGIGTGFLDAGTRYDITTPSNGLYTNPDSNANITIDSSTGTLTAEATSGSCTFWKLYNSRPMGTGTGTWPAPCAVNDSSLDPTVNPDLEYTVNGINSTYYVYTKVVDSRSGITASRPPGGLSVMRGYVSRTSSAQGLDIQPQAYFYYTVEVLAQNKNATTNKVKEVARISFDYAY